MLAEWATAQEMRVEGQDLLSQCRLPAPMLTGVLPSHLAARRADFAASMGFMMPVGTPPNAMVYGSGFVKMRDMIRVGFVLDLLSWLFTVAVLIIFGWLIFGVFTL